MGSSRPRRRLACRHLELVLVVADDDDRVVHHVDGHVVRAEVGDEHDRVTVLVPGTDDTLTAAEQFV